MTRRRGVGFLAALAALLLVSAACGKANNAPGATTNPPASGASFTTLEKGVLAVGSCLDYPPFETVKNGAETGFDVDLTEEIAKRMGLEVKWVKADFDTIFTAVAGGQFDMVAAAVTATGKLGSERDQTVDFSDFYYNSRQSFVVNKDRTPDLTSTDGLKSGDIVGVQKGTTGAAWAKENLEPKGVQIKTFQEAPAAFTDLEGGAIAGVVNDEQSSADIIKDRPSLALVQAIDTNEQYAFAFAPDNPGLLAAWNTAQALVIADGTYAEIFHRYFPNTEVPPEFSPK